MNLVETAPDRIGRKSLSLLQDLLGDFRPRDFAVRLWDGNTWDPEPGQPLRFTIVLRHPAVLRTMFLSPSELSLGEAYIRDDFDIEGDIESAFALGDHLVRRPRGLAEHLQRARELLALPSRKRPAVVRPLDKLRGVRHSLDRDRRGA